MIDHKRIIDLINKGCTISTDSRKIEQGCIFFAIKGDNFDGNDFAETALQKGACLAVVDNKELEKVPNTLLVADTLLFLQQVATTYRKGLNIPVIGLTGSNGKTTTKELISSVLKRRFNTFSTSGNLNNHIGVPISILSINKEHEIAIIEMGANHVGEIETLCKIAQPTFGLITNIGKAHLEGFGSIEGVKKGKSELYKFISNSNGTIFINKGNSTLVELASRHGVTNQISYGTDVFKIKSLNSSSSTLNLRIEVDREELDINSQLIGDYNIENIFAAIRIGKHFGINYGDCVGAIENYSPNNSRSQLLKTSRNTIILDAYNANPSSMELALNNFSSLPTATPKMVILGEMLELGNFSHEEHKRIADLAFSKFQNVILIGENFRGMSRNTLWFINNRECFDFIKNNPIAGYTILMKGSRGVKLEILVESL